MRTSAVWILGLAVVAFGAGCAPAEGGEEFAAAESNLEPDSDPLAGKRRFAGANYEQAIPCETSLELSDDGLTYTACREDAKTGTWEIGGVLGTLNLTLSDGSSRRYSIEKDSSGKITLKRWWALETLSSQ